MQNRNGAVFHAPKRRNRKSITVCLQSDTLEALDVLAKRSRRSRSRLASLLIECSLRAIHFADPPRL